MTFFLLWYAVWLKEKIKIVMRSLLVGISLFIVYVTVDTKAYALELQDIAPWPVVTYLDKFLVLEDTMGNSVAYNTGNKDFFISFKEELQKIPEDDHMSTLASLIDALEEMSKDEIKKTYNLDKEIWLALLKGIYDMVTADLKEATTPKKPTPVAYKPTPVLSTPNVEQILQDNDLYEVERIEHGKKEYYVLSLNKPGTIKNADFHDTHGTFYNCMYGQCDMIVFETSLKPSQAHIIFTTPWKEEKITFSYTNSSSTEKKSAKSKKTELPVEKKVVTEKKAATPATTAPTNTDLLDEDALLKELTDLFNE